jgi:DNA polymerase III delta prime subunit
MLSELKGQKRTVSLLQKMISQKGIGRTLLFLGPKGVGKFTAAIDTAEALLGKIPFSSPDFLFYRNDDFSLKSRFFLARKKNAKIEKLALSYFYYLQGKISSAVSLDEISSSIKFKKNKKDSSSQDFLEFRNTMEKHCVSQTLLSYCEANPLFAENLLTLSDELSKKQKIPIDFVRKAIDFHSKKPSESVKVTVLANMEKATLEAQNASLKLFEEVPKDSLIILTAENKGAILPTILSRSLVINFQKLSQQSLNDIFEVRTNEPFTQTVDFMEDQIYQYSVKKKEKIREFFTKIAPNVQNSPGLFSFIDEISSEESNQLVLHFMEELIEFFRILHLYRQSYLRKIDLSGITKDYDELMKKLAPRIFTSQIKDLSIETGELIRRKKQGNMNEALVLPSLLINIARWYQKTISAKA